MGRVKAAHHRGDHDRVAAVVRARAYADPMARCWRCKRTLLQVRAEQKPSEATAVWTAGHLRDGQVGGPYAAECSPCNFREGAIAGNRARARRRTPLTW